MNELLIRRARLSARLEHAYAWRSARNPGVRYSNLRIPWYRWANRVYPLPQPMTLEQANLHHDAFNEELDRLRGIR